MAGGSIRFEDQDLTRLSDKELRKICGNDISMIFQEPMTSLNPVLKVGRQVRETLLVHNPTMSKAEAKQRVVEMFQRVGIPEAEKRYDCYPHELSGGLRQRVMIAMAMVCKPKLLIADEPTTALDVTIEAQILRLMKELRDETGMSVLIITHNMGVVAEICDYVYVMYAGKIMEQAETFELFDHTMHPYTKGLLDSIPRIGQNAERLHTIPGVVPNLLHLSQGCPFSNRCEYATDQCRTEKAQLHPVAPDHQVRCFRCEEGTSMSEVKHEVLLQAKGIYKNFETSEKRPGRPCPDQCGSGPVPRRNAGLGGGERLRQKHPGTHPDPHAARNQGQRDL